MIALVISIFSTWLTAAPELADAAKEALQRSLHGEVTFPPQGGVRIHYSFESADQFDDWTEYPADAGRGHWVIEKGELTGIGRRGIRHRIKFREQVKLVINFRDCVAGRIHLLDSGDGKAEVRTDYRSLNLSNEKPELLPDEFIKSNVPRIEISLDVNKFILKRGDVSEERPARGNAAGFTGLWAWGTEVKIESVTLSGQPDAEWMRTYQLQAELLKRIEESSATGKNEVDLTPKTMPIVWELNGPEPQRGRGGEYVLFSDELPCHVTFVGLKWKNYKLEGWFVAPENGRLTVRGRAQLNRLTDGACVVKLSPLMLQASSLDSPTVKTEVDLEPDRPHPFKVTWFANTVTVEIDGTQRLHSRMRMGATGGIALLLEGQGTKVGGLSLKLLPCQPMHE